MMNPKESILVRSPSSIRLYNGIIIKENLSKKEASEKRALPIEAEGKEKQVVKS